MEALVDKAVDISAVGFIDDEEFVTETLLDWAEKNNIKAYVTTRHSDVLKWIENREVTHIVSDLRMGNFDTLSFLRTIATAKHAPKVSLLTEFMPSKNDNKTFNELGIEVFYKTDVPELFKSLLDQDTKRIVPAENFYTTFISYGGPDLEIATRIFRYLKSRGVDACFFPESAPPGQRLHRFMYESIQNFDKFLLICSRSSLDRPGVLNELEHVLAKEAQLGGAEVLIPVTLDDYVFHEWSPDRPDLATQVRARVIADFKGVLAGTSEFNSAAGKLVNAFIK